MPATIAENPCEIGHTICPPPPVYGVELNQSVPGKHFLWAVAGAGACGSDAALSWTA